VIFVRWGIPSPVSFRRGHGEGRGTVSTYTTATGNGNSIAESGQAPVSEDDRCHADLSARHTMTNDLPLAAWAELAPAFAAIVNILSD